MSNFDGRIIYRVEADTSGIDKTLDNVQGKAQKAGNSINDSFSSLVTGGAILAATKALVDFGSACVGVASDLDEVQNVIDVTFGDSASAIESWSKTAISQFGLTELQAKQFASTMGAMLKSSGLAGDEIVDMSTSLAGLAADMASFYNMDFETAFAKIRSGISGETEPLKQLGINMSVANLEAYALTQGITKSFDKMSQGEQIMLRYQYLMSATADAQGDFARTSDGLANATRLFNSNIETIKANVGNLLKPAVEDAMNLLASLTSMLAGNKGAKQRTILDDIADIDLESQRKIEQIEQVREKAVILLDVLNSINEIKTTTALSDIASDADELKAQAVQRWTELQKQVAALSGLTGTEAVGNMADDAGKLSGQSVTDWGKLNESASALAQIQHNSAIKDLASDAGTLSGVNNWTTLETAVQGLGNATESQAVSSIAEKANGLSKTAVTNWGSLEQSAANLAGLTNSGGVENVASGAQKLKSGDVTPWQRLRNFVTGLVSAGEKDISGNIANVRDAWLNGINEEGLEQFERLTSAAERLTTAGSTTNTGNAEALTAQSADEMAQMTQIANALGISLIDTVSAEDLWLETCRQLVNTIPGLSSIINTQTGEIEGGTDAVLDYVNAWERLEKGKILWSAYNRKQALVESEFADLPDLILDAAVARRRVGRAFEGTGTNATDLRAAYNMRAVRADATFTNANGETYTVSQLLDLADAETQASNELYRRTNALNEATDALEEEKEALLEMYPELADYIGETEDAANAIDEMTTRIKTAEEALRDVADYMNTVREETQRAVKGVAKGFEEIVTPAQRAQRELQELNRQLEEGLITQEQFESKTGETGVVKTIQGMNRGLQSQLAYYQEYNRLIAVARSKNVSEELLASLSDGSEESFDYLTAIAGATDDEIRDLNRNYAAVQSEQETLTDVLTQNKLAVDDHFAQLVDTARTAVNDLDMTEGAQNASSSTVQGIINGISEKYPSLVSEIDAVIAQMNRLTSFSWFSMDISSGVGKGSGDFYHVSGSGGRIPQYSIGLDYVPFNGFLASLHEGEAILTAEENRAWQMFKNGGAASANSVDYGRLSGAIWENAPRMGGNVYLDGQTVGRVISDRQAESLRTLTRSGWQS